jgi:PadR family transcriptional regulator PadR
MAQNDNFNVDNWATQIRRGLLELCVLNMVAEGEVYGYDLVRRLTEMRGLGIAEGSIYPLLSRMRKAGLLRARLEESPNGPARKYYALTQNGVNCCTMMNSHWDELARGIYSLRPGEDESNGNRSEAPCARGDVSPSPETLADVVAGESET